MLKPGELVVPSPDVVVVSWRGSPHGRRSIVAYSCPATDATVHRPMTLGQGRDPPRIATSAPPEMHQSVVPLRAIINSRTPSYTPPA